MVSDLSGPSVMVTIYLHPLPNCVERSFIASLSAYTITKDVETQRQLYYYHHHFLSQVFFLPWYFCS
jgi:hypothetical protein